ncbi:MAG: hypothetical protein GY809_10710, partial [Planctomycetes bacterium]|nr:hypothetical protein [Planctomycetota bacterium]
MIHKDIATMSMAVGAVAAVTDKAGANTDSAAVDKALETLKTYDWGDDRKTLNPIDQAIIDTHDDTAARKALEKSLVDALASGISRSAQDFVCRKLRVIGTGQAIKALAALLPDEDASNIARYALGRMKGRRAGTALRNALPKVDSKLKPGIVGSLGIRRDQKSTGAITKLLGDSNIDVA